MGINAGTAFNCGETRAIPSPQAFQRTFLRHYEQIKALLGAHRRPGVALLAFDTSRDALVGTLALEARPGEVRAAIVGRHTEADLQLVGDDELSLRHLVLLVHPYDGDEVRFSVLDLRTRTAFVDECGRRLEAVEAEGPVLLSVGRFQLFLLLTEAEPCWPDGARDGWACVPERVLLGEREADLARRRLEALRRRGRRVPREDDAPPTPRPRTMSVIRSTPGPRFTSPMVSEGAVEGPSDELLQDGERAIGTLAVRFRGREQQLPLGPAAARRGVLIGRYDRCNAASILTEHSISRVHLLILQIDGTLYAIDTCSTNGCWRPRPNARPEAVRVLPLAERGETRLLLTNWLRAEVCWTPA